MIMLIKPEYMPEFYEYVKSNLSSFKWIEEPMYVDHDIFFGHFILVFYVNEEDKIKLYNNFIKKNQEKELRKLDIYITAFFLFGISSIFIIILITLML